MVSVLVLTKVGCKLIHILSDEFEEVVELVDAPIRNLDVLSCFFIITLLPQFSCDTSEIELLCKGIQLLFEVSNTIDPLAEFVNTLFAVLDASLQVHVTHIVLYELASLLGTHPRLHSRRRTADLTHWSVSRGLLVLLQTCY